MYPATQTRDRDPGSGRRVVSDLANLLERERFDPLRETLARSFFQELLFGMNASFWVHACCKACAVARRVRVPSNLP